MTGVQTCALPISTATARGVSCNTGHFWNRDCNGTAECDRIWAEHIADEHSGGASNPGSANATYPVFSWRGSPSKAFVEAIVFGAPVGALLGSVATDVNGRNQAPIGAALGGSLSLAISALANPQWSRAAKAGVGALAGAGMGASIGSYLDGQVVTGSAEDITAKKKVGTYAAVGAGAGSLLGLTPDSEMRFFRALNAVLRPGRRVALLQRGNNVGANIEW